MSWRHLSLVVLGRCEGRVGATVSTWVVVAAAARPDWWRAGIAVLATGTSEPWLTVVVASILTVAGILEGLGALPSGRFSIFSDLGR